MTGEVQCQLFQTALQEIDIGQLINGVIEVDWVILDAEFTIARYTLPEEGA